MKNTLFLFAAFLAASITGAHAQPAFRSASSAATSNSPAFRAASSAIYGAEVRFRAASSAATNTSTLTISLPTGTLANDVLIAAIGVRPSTATIAAPFGWTLVRRTDSSGAATNSLAVFRRLAGSSEPASFAFDVTGATQAVGGIQAFANVDTANPIDVEAGQATASALAHATPSVTTTVANAMLVTAHTFSTSTTWAPPSGMTEAFDRQYQPVPTNEGQSIEGTYVKQTAAGASGAKTATAAGGSGAEDYGVTHILALRPPAAALTINVPTGTAANDVLIAAVAIRPSAATITPPSGWTLVRRVDNASGQTNSLAVYRRVASGSEPASYSWTVGNGATYAVGGIQAFYNVDTLNPIDVEAGQATPYSLNHATQSVTTTVANAMLVTAHAFATSTTWTPPSGMTEAYDTQFLPLPQGQGHSIEGNYVLQPAAGATGVKTASAAGVSGDQDEGNAHILALRPASAVLTINRPSGSTANDVLIAAIGVRPSSAAINAPSGWTLVRRTDNAVGQTNSLAVFRKVAGSEPASYAFDAAGAVHAVGGIQAFFNVDTANPIDVEGGQATGFSLSHATPSVTTTVPNAMLVTAHTFTTSTTWTAAAGMTEAFDTQFQPVPQGQGQSIEASYALQASAAATGAKTATAAGGSGDQDEGVTHILALRPVPALASQLYFIHADHLNTPRLVANDQRQAVWRWDQQEPFGVNVPDENPSGLGAFEFPMRFPGQYFDKETNLYYNYFRDYDPYIGRYMESDPIGLVDGINTYAYVRSNPAMRVDVQGLQSATPSPAQEKAYQKCLDSELKSCTISIGGVCAIVCLAAGAKFGLTAAIVVGGLCYAIFNPMCVNDKIKYCTEKWLK